MGKKKLIILGSAVVLTVFSLVAYFTFNYLGITFSRVRRREITLVSEGAQKLYDGTPLTNDNWYFESGALEEGDTMIVTMEANITMPGTIANDPGVTILNSENENVTGNYNIILKSGDLTVLGRRIVVSTPSETKSYDGLPLSNDNYNLIYSELFGNHRVEFTMNSSITEPGSIDNEIIINVYDSANNIVNEIYDFEVETGVLTVLERTITVSTDSASKIYDGEALTSDSYTLDQSQLLASHRIEYVMDSSITNPGTKANRISITIYDESNNIVTDVYNIEYDFGDLTVISREFTVTTGSAEKTYDGSALTEDTYHIPTNAVLDSHRIEYSMGSSITNPGSIDNDITITIYDSEDKRVNYLYDINYDLGTLTVHKIDVVLSSESEQKLYDGTALSNSNWTEVSDTLISGHTLQVSMPSSITDPGTIDNEIVANIYDSQSNIVNNYYNIEYNLGTLEVTARSVIIETVSDSKVYDGTALENFNMNTIYDELLTGHRIVHVMSSSITNAGTIDNDIEVFIYDNNDTLMNDYYDIVVNLGTLTIEQRNLTIQTATAEKIYDGTPLTDPTMVLLVDELLASHHIDYDMNSTITNPGTTNNEIGVTVLDDSDNIVTSNYDISYDLGTLTITARQVVIETNSDSKLYDGTALTNSGYIETLNELLPGHTMTVSVTSSIINPGYIDNEAQVQIFDASSNLITDLYNVQVDEGTLTVLARDIVVQTESNSKIYDGSALTHPVYHVISEDLLAGHTTVYSTMNSSITNPGVVDNEITVTVLDGSGLDVTHLYNVDYQLGTLTVQQIPLTIQTESITKTYDGVAITSSIWSYGSGSLMAGHTYSVVMNSTITNPGSIDNEIGFTIYDASSNVVNHLYDITYNLGTLEVRAIEIVISSESASKVYDGTPLTNPNYDHLSGTVLAGHTLNIIVDGTITDVGVIDNNVYAYVEDGSGNSVNQYYTFTYNEGVLEVLTGVNSSSTIATSSFTPSTASVFQIFSTQSENIYFRDTSYGDYNLQGFDEAVVQNLSITTNPLNFTSTALLEESYSETSVQVDYLRDQVSYLVPNYTSDTFTSLNDVHISGDITSVSSFDYIDYAFDLADNYQITDPTIAAEELLYRSFVHNNYLDLPATTRSSLETIATANGLVSTSPTIIEDVKDYIQNAATYNLNFPSIPSNQDVVIYFLTQSQEGICQHFAAAATVMYRAMGIPARYVTGYSAVSVANNWEVITADRGHAWVEIYIDGFGWVPMEVTGGSVDPSLPDIHVTPVDVEQMYVPGTTITATNAIVEGFDDYAALGYTYSVTFGGSLSTPGIADSTIASFSIYDASSQDVTDEFNIFTHEGELQLYEYDIDFTTHSLIETYDGSTHTNETYDDLSASLGAGHYEVVSFNASITDAGYVLNTATITIYDSSNQDVTYLYHIDTSYGILVINPRAIIITAADASKTYDGTALTSSGYVYDPADLALGDTLTVTTTGSQTEVGVGINFIDTVSFTRAGVPIDSNYTVTTVEGSLTVTP